MQSRTSAGDGDDARIMRTNLVASLPPEEQERFITVLKDALGRGLGNDEAWEEAWLAVQTAEGKEHGDDETDFALEDEEA